MAALGACCGATLPPWSAIYRWFAKLRDEGRFEKIDHALVILDRGRIKRHRRQSERQDDRGWRAARLTTRRSTGQAPCTRQHGWAWPRARTASGENPRSQRRQTASVCPRLPFTQRVFADSGYAGEKVARHTLIAVGIVRKKSVALPLQVEDHVRRPRCRRQSLEDENAKLKKPAGHRGNSWGNSLSERFWARKSASLFEAEATSGNYFREPRGRLAAASYLRTAMAITECPKLVGQ